MTTGAIIVYTFQPSYNRSSGDSLYCDRAAYLLSWWYTLIWGCIFGFLFSLLALLLACLCCFVTFEICTGEKLDDGDENNSNDDDDDPKQNQQQQDEVYEREVHVTPLE